MVVWVGESDQNHCDHVSLPTEQKTVNWRSSGGTAIRSFRTEITGHWKVLIPVGYQTHEQGSCEAFLYARSDGTANPSKAKTAQYRTDTSRFHRVPTKVHQPITCLLRRIEPRQTLDCQSLTIWFCRQSSAATALKSLKTEKTHQPTQ